MKFIRKDIFRRMLQALLPMALLFGVVIGSSQVKLVKIASDTQAVYVKATVRAILEDNTQGEPFSGNQKVQAVITSGQLKGETCELVNANSYQRGALCAPGTKVIAFVAQEATGELKGSVYNYDRTGMVWMLVALFAVILLAVGGKKGALSLYALFFTFVCIVCMYVPMLYVGLNAILAAILTAVLVLVASIYILNGWSLKTACAIVGTTAGVAISGLLAMLIGRMSNLSGFHMPEVESMVYIANHAGLDVANILYAGVLISSLGAVMDVSVSIVAAMQEIHENAPHLQAKELFLSGMRVGHDMMGTMSNTLILAYTGSATSVLLTVYSYEMTYLQTMGHNSIVIEILCGLCGTIGVVLTVPLQTLVTTIAIKSGRIRKIQ